MKQIMSYISMPFKWLWGKIEICFSASINAILDLLISPCGAIILMIIAVIGGCTGISYLCDINTRWQIDPANTYEGNFLTLKVTDACSVFAEDLESGEKIVLNTMQRLRVNNDPDELHRLRMSLIANRVYWFRYIKKNDSEDPTIIQAELLDHIPPRPPKLINKGPKYNVFEQEQENGNEKE
jgi:hypothetical protein